ncbi:MAG: DNA gyrase inhibitor YacG [Rubrivivax sp.]|nr:DNA gyrase inhibitor YacG [Rubrivivax sp.]
MKKNRYCPVCKRRTVYAQENPFRPFCSERCKLIDLGEWLDGKYAIPASDDESDRDTAEEHD